MRGAVGAVEAAAATEAGRGRVAVEADRAPEESWVPRAEGAVEADWVLEAEWLPGPAGVVGATGGLMRIGAARLVGLEGIVPGFEGIEAGCRATIGGVVARAVSLRWAAEGGGTAASDTDRGATGGEATGSICSVSSPGAKGAGTGGIWFRSPVRLN